MGTATVYEFEQMVTDAVTHTLIKAAPLAIWSCSYYFSLWTPKGRTGESTWFR